MEWDKIEEDGKNEGIEIADIMLIDAAKKSLPPVEIELSSIKRDEHVGQDFEFQPSS